MIKLKNILSEGFAWERKEGKGLPTLAEVQAEYERTMQENEDCYDDSESEMDEAVSQEEADKRWNSPIQMGMRDISKPTISNSTKAPSNFYHEKLVALKAQRRQIEFDMEQEAEPEGGPIADYYGEALQHVDDQINAIKQKMGTNESIDEVSSRTHVVYACNVELADGTIKPGVRISVPKGDNAEQQVRDKIQDRFGKDSKIRTIAKAQNPHINDNDKDEVHEARGEDGRIETVSAKRAAAELKQYIKGKRSDGMGDYTSTIYGIDDAGKKVKITSQDQLSKFKTFGLTDKDEPANANEKPDYIDADNDGNEDESMKDAFKDKNENINESFVGRLKKNLIGGATRK